MARPKHDENAASAKERIESAYWTMLESGKYETLTVRALARTAGVNHNLIYYYYNNIDDLAEKAFCNMLSKETLELLLNGIRSGHVPITAITDNPELMVRFKRVKLYLRGDSSWLTSIFRSAIRETWLSQLGRDEEDLSVTDRIDLNFIIEGLMYAISCIGQEVSLEDVMSIIQRDLGQGIIATLKRLDQKEPVWQEE